MTRGEVGALSALVALVLLLTVHKVKRQKRLQRMLGDATNSTIERWRKLAGYALDTMLQDRGQALVGLADLDPKIRHAALSVLVFHWNSDQDRDFAHRCEQMALNDSDDTVRSVALRLLGECYKNSHNERIGNLMAKVVRDEAQSTQCRSGAYLALFRLRGEFAEWPGRDNPAGVLFRFPDHVDWAFVDSFYDEEEREKGTS